MNALTRRQILSGSAAVAALSVAPRPAAAGGVQLAAASEEWIELETAIKETILDGHRVRLRAYNGQIPGPTMTIAPGQTLRVRLKNSLPPYDSSQWGGDHNVPHGFDATNLHVHGLDVIPHIFEPIGTSDPLAPQKRTTSPGAKVKRWTGSWVPTGSVSSPALSLWTSLKNGSPFSK